MTTVTAPSVSEHLAALGLWTGTAIESEEGPTMASPSWWGADSRRHCVRAAHPDLRCGTSAFVKTMEPHASGYVDVATSFAAAAAAGAAGLAPVVHVADPDTGVLVTADHTGACHTATLDLFDSPDALARVVALRKAVHTLPAFGRVATVFDDLSSVLEAARSAGATLPVDLDWMLRLLAGAEARITASGFDLVPVHGDGNVSNLLVLDSGELLLVDFDCAAMADPLQDLGVLLAEFAPLDRDAREIFEMSWGSWDSALFDRARLYGIADQVRWGVIGAYCDAVRPGTHEYSKFSDWQFLRARAGLRDPHFDDRIRNL